MHYWFHLVLPLIWCMAGVNVLANPPFHVGVVTGSTMQSEDAFRGAEALVGQYGSIQSGGMIKHITYPDDSNSRGESLSSSIDAMAHDPNLKAIIVNPAIVGTAKAFQNVHAQRPDILCLAGETDEEPSDISPAADLVVSRDYICRGYTIAWAAKKMGAQILVYGSFPRHLAMEQYGRQCAIMAAACKDLGIGFKLEKAYDPAVPDFAAESQPMIERPMSWLKKYGPHGEPVAFICSADGQTESMIHVLIASKNGILVEAEDPGPLMGYLGGLGLNLSSEFLDDMKAVRGDFPAIQKKFEETIVAKGGGRPIRNLGLFLWLYGNSWPW